MACRYAAGTKRAGVAPGARVAPLAEVTRKAGMLEDRPAPRLPLRPRGRRLGTSLVRGEPAVRGRNCVAVAVFPEDARQASSVVA